MYPGVELRLLRYVVAVAEELHFSRAAEKLHAAQPSLSKQIRDREDELGIRLFDRTKRDVHLTVAGGAFVAEAKEALVHSGAPSTPRRRRSSRTSVPACTHCWKRRRQVWYGGDLWRGSSDHCAPVRKIHNTPSSTSRQGRPPRFLGVLGSTSGFSNSHRTSGSPMLPDMPRNSSSHNYLVRFVFMR